MRNILAMAKSQIQVVGILLRNFKAFKAINLAQLPPYSVFVGANGTGKSTLFDVFGFLRDCLRENVRAAVQKRGGFKELATRGSDNPAIEIRLRIRMSLPRIGERTVTYAVQIAEKSGRIVVANEILKYKRLTHGQPFEFMNFSDGAGGAIVNEADIGDEVPPKRESQRLDEPDILAIKGLGQFQRFEAASAIRTLIERWHVSDFHVQAARPSQEAGYAEHLSAQGENLPLVAQYMFERHPEAFNQVLTRMAERVPGVTKVEAIRTEDARIVLRFQDRAFVDPFAARSVSDGTIKMFAYLLLLNDPEPHPLLCIEEPENQLYPALLAELGEEFQEYASRGQVMVTTHSPDLLNATPLESIFLLRKQRGITSILRASDDANLAALIQAGDRPGELWRQRVFPGIDP